MSDAPEEMTPAERVELLEEVLGRVSDYPDQLSAWEKSFMEDFEKKFKEYGTRTRVSDKQLTILQRIKDKT